LIQMYAMEIKLASRSSIQIVSSGTETQQNNWRIVGFADPVNEL
jgi:hypothetical protein